jgi:acyl carrier protein
MKRQKVFEFVKAFVYEQLGWSDVEYNSRLFGDLGFDSLDLTELVMALEKKFSVKINDVCVDSWKTVEDVVNTVCRLIP